MKQKYTLSARRRLFAVFCGGFCGTLARALLSPMLQNYLGSNWPYDILLINLTGALLLAFCTTLADAALVIGPTRRLFINVGFLGTYTTFSSLAMGDVLLFAGNQWGPALLYLVLSISGGMLAILSGDLCAQWYICVLQRKPQTASLTQLPKSADKHIDIDDELLLSESEPPHSSR